MAKKVRAPSRFTVEKNDRDRGGYLVLLDGSIVLWSRLKCHADQAAAALDRILPVSAGGLQEKTVRYFRGKVGKLETAKEKLVL